MAFTQLAGLYSPSGKSQSGNELGWANFRLDQIVSSLALSGQPDVRPNKHAVLNLSPRRSDGVAKAGTANFALERPRFEVLLHEFIEHVMRNPKAVVVAGLAFMLVVACAVDASRGQGDRKAETKKIRIVTVVKRTGIGWFERMEEGIKQFAAQNGVDATMTGAAEADPQKQADIIRKLIAEKPDAITVVPNSPKSLEGVLKQARAAGIKVVTHEASNQVNTDVDIEAFNNLAYGSHLMDELASCMGGSGKYVAFVGHTTARSHMLLGHGRLRARATKVSEGRAHFCAG